MNEPTLRLKPAGLNLIEQTADIVSAYVSNNHVKAADLPGLIATTYAALASFSQKSSPVAPATEKLTPAQIRKSITHDALISFEDGKSYKTLKRHLTLRGLSPQSYREKWGLPCDYPMTAANYSAHRSALAKSLGLGEKRRKYVEPEPAQVAATAADQPKKASRPRKAKEPVEA